MAAGSLVGVVGTRVAEVGSLVVGLSVATKEVGVDSTAMVVVAATFIAAQVTVAEFGTAASMALVTAAAAMVTTEEEAVPAAMVVPLVLATP